MELDIALLTPLWLLFPAMTSNSWAVIFGGGTPMDFGRSWRGKRIFGDGKTWRGLLFGVIFGTLVGLAEIALMDAGLIRYSPTHWGFGSTYLDAVPLLVVLCVGALLGDTSKSFIKRRLGMERGHKVPFLDWYDFLIGALVLAFIFYFSWTLDNLFLNYNWIGMLFLLLLIPPMHRLFNIIGYKMGKKNVPW